MSHAISVPEEAREQLNATVAALRQPATYPGTEAPNEAIETHMAWVFLTASHAYKLKKPIRARLIDHRTVEARRRACHTEVELNRRLAAPVYLGVVPLAEDEDGLRLEGEGSPVDWLVKMRRLPGTQMLDARIENDQVSHASIDQLGTTLAAFYRTAAPVRWSGDEYQGQLVANLTSKRSFLERPRYDLDQGLVRAVARAQSQWRTEHAPLLKARASRVVDAHGDLRPEHICLTDPPLVIDCLEFNRSLRLLDPLSELSFLSLECRRLGAEWIGDEIIALYRQHTGDDASPRLVPFYESYHAVVRATIAVWHLDDKAFGDTNTWREQAEAYLRLAQERL